MTTLPEVAMKETTHKIETTRQGAHGKSCPFCGGQAYLLFLHPSHVTGNPTLLVQCHQCHHARTLNNASQDILWM